MKQRDLLRKLSEAGFQEVRHDGDHLIYVKPGFQEVQVPKHREINEMLARTILKQAGINFHR